MLSSDLAKLYEVETRALTQAVRRNAERFPDDFMFQLSNEEVGHLRSQSVILAPSLRTYTPLAFTEQGVAMRSKRAIAVNIEIMRAFVRLRSMLESNKELAKQLATLEKKYDAQFKIVFQAIYELMGDQEKKTERKIGFV